VFFDDQTMAVQRVLALTADGGVPGAERGAALALCAAQAFATQEEEGPPWLPGPPPPPPSCQWSRAGGG